MTIALSALQVSLDGWFIVTVAMLTVWIWQGLVRRDRPVLSIEPDESRLMKQRAFLQKTERLRRYILAFMTASVVFGIAVIVAWLYQRLE